MKSDDQDLKNKSQEYWKEKLTPEQFQVTRKKATEKPFTGEYDDFYEDGEYVCVNCGKKLFASDAKYDAGCGWPSFDRPEENKAVSYEDDNSFGMHRVEVLCSNCNAHLGHVFQDGPKETTGQRYCINSAALKFHKK